MIGWRGLYMKHSICLSIFIYKPWLVNEGGQTMRVAHPSFQTKLSLIQTSAARLLIGGYSYLLGILCLTFYCLATTITTYPEGKKELKQQISGDESKFKHIQTLKVGHKSLFTYVGLSGFKICICSWLISS